MSKSLQQQLIDSGLATATQAKKTRQDKARRSKAARRQGAPDEGRQRAEQVAAADAAKRERDRELNERRQAQRAAREREAAIVQIIDSNRLAVDGDHPAAVPYNYTLDNRIRRMDVSEAQRRELADGRLGIVRYRGASSVVPAATAERLKEYIPDRVWVVAAADPAPAEDDPYADYQVPDDLMR